MNIAEIARRANVSTATVSRTLNQSGPVKAATARKVWRAVTKLNYYPNSHARALVSGRSRLIGLVVSDTSNPFLPELIQRFEEHAAKEHYDLLVTSTTGERERMDLCLRRMLERKVDGVAMMTTMLDQQLTSELGSRGIPVVFLDAGAVGPRMSHVSIDYAHGLQQALDHLVALGHRDIAFISGPTSLYAARQRRQAYVSALATHGLALDRRLVREGRHTADSGERALAALLQGPRRPTAIIGSNDWTAIGALRGAVAAGLRVPHDLSIVGFDDIPLASYTTPPLTTIRMATADVCGKALEALFTLIGGDRRQGDSYAIAPRLVVRESTGPRS
jgi:DNA-binding LacI/PurR family transcriptional regulator